MDNCMGKKNGWMVRLRGWWLMGHTAHMPAASGVLQGSLLEEGSARDLMKFSRNECKVLPQRFPWDGLGGGSSAEQHLGSGEQLTECQPAACPSNNEGRQHPGLC